MRAIGKPIHRMLLGGIVLLLALLSACNPPPPTAAPGGGNLAANTDQAADWQTKWSQTRQAARQEGKVVVVTHTNLYFREQIQKFSEKYPDIQVEHVAIRPSEFTPKVVTEPQNWRGGKLIYANTEPYILLHRGNVTGGVWVNRDLVPRSEFSTLDQLTDPRFRGKLAIRTPNAPHNASLTMTGLLHGKGEDFVATLLSQQQPVYIENARLLTQNLINGRYPIVLGVDNETLDNCQREGGCKNLEEVRGYEYLLGHGIGVLKNVPHPNAAAVFANWFLSKEGQQVWVQTIADTTPEPRDGAHTARVDVEPHPDVIAQGTMPDYANLSKYSLQGMEAGAEEMQTVLSLYRRVEASGTR